MFSRMAAKKVSLETTSPISANFVHIFLRVYRGKIQATQGFAQSSNPENVRVSGEQGLENGKAEYMQIIPRYMTTVGRNIGRAQ
jgi:hypothetical protein